jgi:hypothetical protein
MPSKRSASRDRELPPPAKVVATEPETKEPPPIYENDEAKAAAAEETVKAAKEAFGVENEEKSTWNSSSAVVRSVPTSTALVKKALEYDPNDISHQLAHLFGSTNIYWKDVATQGRHIEAEHGGTYLDNHFIRLQMKPFIPQRFNNERLPGLHVLLPICVVSQASLPPYGTIDGDPTSEYAVPSNAKEKAKIQLSVRPGAYNRFTQSEDGLWDAVALASWAWMYNVLEPMIKQGMDANGETSAQNWSTATAAKADPTSLQIHASKALFRDPYTPEEYEQLEKKTYKAYTESLTKLCNAKVVIMNDGIIALRVTTPEERSTLGLLQPLSWREQSMIQVGDEVMPLLKMQGLKKRDTYHPKTDLGGFIWFGPSKHFGGMQANTVEEKLRCIPPFPAPSSAEQMYKRKEKQLETKEFTSKVETLRASRENA